VQAAAIAVIEWQENHGTHGNESELEGVEEITKGAVLEQTMETLDENATNGALSVDPVTKTETGSQEELLVDTVGTKANVTNGTITATPITNGVDVTITPVNNATVNVDTLSDATTIPPPTSVDTSLGTSAVPIITNPITTITDDVVSGVLDHQDVIDVLTNSAISNIPISIPSSTTVANPDKIDTIPATSITINPIDLGEQIGLSIRTQTSSVSRALQEQNTLRHDRKPAGMWYLAGLRFVNKTWGKVSELLDFYNVFTQNVTLPEMEIKLPSGEVIYVKAGQKLSELPRAYQNMVLRVMLQQQVDGIPGSDFTIDFEQLIMDTFLMESLDLAVGQMMRTERDIIEQSGIGGLLDYGNATTWVKRLNRYIASRTTPQAPPTPAGKPPPP
jgi:hypothetical protein